MQSNDQTFWSLRALVLNSLIPDNMLHSQYSTRFTDLLIQQPAQHFIALHYRR
jgi:hypothetical protein